MLLTLQVLLLSFSFLMSTVDVYTISLMKTSLLSASTVTEDTLSCRSAVTKATGIDCALIKNLHNKNNTMKHNTS